MMAAHGEKVKRQFGASEHEKTSTFSAEKREREREKKPEKASLNVTELVEAGRCVCLWLRRYVKR